jgi:FkbM family methyltransferase
MKNSIIEHLDKDTLQKLFSESLDDVYKREQSSFDKLAGPFKTSLVLFGAGGLGKKTLAGLRRIGIEPLAFADNNPTLWGKDINGLPVLSLEDASRKFGKSAAFVVTIWKGEATDTMAERQKQLTDLSCEKVIPFSYLYWKYGSVFLPHYAFDMPHKVFEQYEEVRKVFSLWSDDASRREYVAQLKWRMFMDFDGLPAPVTHEIYFPDDLTSFLPNEEFIDCGAYDGDTIRSLLKVIDAFSGNIIAFEPDPENFRKLEEYASSLKGHTKEILKVYPFAIGAQKSRVRFEASGTESSSVGSGDIEVDCVALDEILADQRPTYIKMDIEGSELQALAGAQNIIKRNLPVLAICSYHSQAHLWKIPALINSYSDQYRFFLRPHLLEVWDLVCYAIPANRLHTGK